MVKYWVIGVGSKVCVRKEVSDAYAWKNAVSMHRGVNKEFVEVCKLDLDTTP